MSKHRCDPVRQKNLAAQTCATLFDWWIIPPRHLEDRYQTLPDAETRLRDSVEYWGEFDRLSDHPCVDQWRVAAVDRQSGVVAGVVRLLLSDHRNRNLTAEDIVRFGSVSFADKAIRNLHLAALEQFIESAKSGPIGYIGEFFVSKQFRRTRLCLELGLSLHSLASVHGWSEGKGITFSTTRANADKLFLRMGGYELTVNGIPTPNFFCNNHQGYGQLLGLELHRCQRPGVRGIILAIQENFQSRATS